MRTLTGVSVETVRHWRKTVPYLASKTGKATRFTFTDLLGLSVTNELVRSLGVHIATVSAGVDALFRLLDTSNALTLKGSVALLTPTSATLSDVAAEGVGPAPKQPTLVIPLDPLIMRIQQHMLPMALMSSEVALPFSLEATRSKA